MRSTGCRSGAGRFWMRKGVSPVFGESKVFNLLRRVLVPATVVGGLSLVLVGGFAMAAFVGGFNIFAEVTSSTEFCTSCHEMGQNLTELKKTIHFSNRTGVRATCQSCHVPHSFFPKMAAKMFAVKDLYHHLIGSINTPEKYEEQRLSMAKKVWAKMEANQSRECRGCHDFDAMKLEDQGRRTKVKHPQAIQEGKHCINCHKGIAHELPKGYEGD
jgi:cytochrome c-type protein NapC